MAEGKKARREEELVEAALAAAAAALFVSGVKKLMPAVLLARWPAALLATAPSPVLFLLLNIIIASIVVVSVQPRRAATAAVAQKARCGEEGIKKVKRRRSKRRESESAEPAQPVAPPVAADCCISMALVVKDGPAEMQPATTAELGEEADEVAGNAAEEVNKRAEEFISAFRHHLRVDSFSSGSRRGGARIAACF
ncbi:hypothetical protein ABZP36_035823 [Zizania latifolia]